MWVGVCGVPRLRRRPVVDVIPSCQNVVRNSKPVAVARIAPVIRANSWRGKSRIAPDVEGFEGLSGSSTDLIPTGIAARPTAIKKRGTVPRAILTDGNGIERRRIKTDSPRGAARPGAIAGQPRGGEFQLGPVTDSPAIDPAIAGAIVHQRDRAPRVRRCAIPGITKPNTCPTPNGSRPLITRGAGVRKGVVIDLVRHGAPHTPTVCSMKSDMIIGADVVAKDQPCATIHIEEILGVDQAGTPVNHVILDIHCLVRAQRQGPRPGRVSTIVIGAGPLDGDGLHRGAVRDRERIVIDQAIRAIDEDASPTDALRHRIVVKPEGHLLVVPTTELNHAPGMCRPTDEGESRDRSEVGG